MIGETVTVLDRAVSGVDGHGNPIYTTTETDVSGVAVAPRQGEEQGGGAREMVIVGLTVFMPPGSVVSATGMMRVRGELYQVVGEPGVWANPYTGVTRGVQVALERVEG